jgi:hypothetical protein
MDRVGRIKSQSPDTPEISGSAGIHWNSLLENKVVSVDIKNFALLYLQKRLHPVPLIPLSLLL